MTRYHNDGVFLFLIVISLLCPAVLADQTFTITATAGPDGTINPDGPIQVMEGSNQTFIMTPDAGNINCWGGGTTWVVWNYSIDDQTVAIEPSREAVTYTFTNVTSDHTIHADFEEMIIDARPFAQFTVYPESGFTYFPFNFTLLQVSNHTGLLWDFGDNTTSSEYSPLHAYQGPGNYTVSLTVYCENLTYIKTADNPISVIDMPPIGGDKGYFLVHSNVDGAEVYFNGRYRGTIENGTFLATIYLTASPIYNYTVQKQGYSTFTAPITTYPPKDGTIDLYANLEPVTSFFVPLGDGWSLFSTPVSLDAGYSGIDHIFNESEQEKIAVVLGWNGYWFIPDTSYDLVPLQALYVKVNGEAVAYLLPSSDVTPPPSRSLPEGVSLISAATPYEDGTFTVMPVSQALISINETSGGKTGYSMVISPALNQPGWGYARGGPMVDILPFRGYWVVMENADTFYGFSTTPLGT
jgi:PKD repeat protein